MNPSLNHLVVSLQVYAGLSAGRIEQGQSFTITINYENKGGDTGWSARAVLQVHSGFNIISPNPTLLSDIAPFASGKCSFTVSTSDDLGEGSYVLTVAIECEERHFYSNNIPYSFPASLTVTIVELAKKRAARTSLENARRSLAGLGESIAQLQRAGDNAENLRLEHDRLLREVQKAQEVFTLKAFEKVITDCDGLASEAAALKNKTDELLETLRKEAMNEIEVAQRAKSATSWAGEEKLTSLMGYLNSAQHDYEEGRYSDSVKMARAFVSTLPRPPLVVRMKHIWRRMIGKSKIIGALLIILGVSSGVVIVILLIDGSVSIFSILPSLVSILLGLGANLRGK